jgi:hypothetical protein
MQAINVVEIDGRHLHNDICLESVPIKYFQTNVGHRAEFHQHFTGDFFASILALEYCNANLLSYEKRVRKILMKLTPDGLIVV